MNRLVALFVVLGFVAVSAAQAGETYEEYQKNLAAAEQGTLTAKGMKQKPRLMTKDIIITKIQNQEPLEFNSELILFEYGVPRIRQDSMAQVEQIAEGIKDPRFQKIPFFYVDGHTCSIGTDTNNCRLSWERARAMIDALVERGVDRSRLQPRGFGETTPRFSNDTDEERQKNRRVVLLGRDAAENMKGKSLADRYEAGLTEVCKETTGQNTGNPNTRNPDNQPMAGPGNETPGPGPGGSPVGTDESVNSLQRRAERGDVTAMCTLGDKYYYGEGVEQDYAKANEWYREAVDAGAACTRSKGFREYQEKSLRGSGDTGAPHGFIKRKVTPGGSEKPEGSGTRVKGFQTTPVGR